MLDTMQIRMRSYLYAENGRRTGMEKGVDSGEVSQLVVVNRLYIICFDAGADFQESIWWKLAASLALLVSSRHCDTILIPT
jgi:hypothetical protein